MRKLAFVLAALLCSSAIGAQAPAGHHVLLVTIDGLRGDYIGEADRYHLKRWSRSK